MPEQLVRPRSVPGLPYSLSELTVTVPPALPSRSPTDPVVVPLLRKARALGVTTFDLCVPGFEDAAEELFLRAFPEPDGELIAIVRPRPPAPGPSRGSPAPSRPGASSTPRSTDPAGPRAFRLSGRARLIVEWEPGPPDGPVPSLPPELVERRDRGEILDVAVRLRVDELSAHLDARLVAGSLSLRAPAFVDRLPASHGPAALIARDVYADGALDGSLIFDSPIGRAPGAGPPSLPELHRRLDPILGLGFLTRRGRRTLAQAALEYVLRWPWTATAVVPLPPVERFASMLRPPPDVGFTDEELRRIAAGPAWTPRSPAPSP